ncbi:MAG: hypothetical protein KGI69_03975 [Patescibacteria group bacterium]|nr:hypothetical protein [Patescibacteria group bacterium]
MSPKIKGTMRSLTDEWGWNMVWTHTIADHALMRAVEDGMAYGTLPKAVMIVANDHHFCDIVCKLAATGRTALVSGTKVSKRLREASSACFELWDLIGENPEKVDWQSYDERHKGTPAFNGIRFPEGL